MCSSNSSLQGSGSCVEEEAERLEEAEGMDDTKETVSSNHNRTDTHELTETDMTACTGLARSKSDGVLALRARSGHKPPSLTKMLSPIDNCLQRENDYMCYLV